MQQTPHWAQGRRLHGKPTQTLHGRRRQRTQRRVPKNSSALKQQNCLVFLRSGGLPQARASRTTHGHAVGTAHQTHQ